MQNIKELINKLEINHVFGMAGLIYIQPDIKLLTLEDVIKAEKIVSDLCTRINWDLEIENSPQNEAIIINAEKITDAEQEKYFNEVYKHFNIEK